MLLATLFSVALVVQDQSSLRAAAQDSAPRQATLWQGEWLEVRGERQGFLQVWDHKRERGGYVRQQQVRAYTLDEKSAPQLAAVVDFLRDSPGAEALGIGYAASFLKAAPPAAVGPEVFDALGTMADRLAQRASARNGNKATEDALAAHLDVVASYGVKMKSFEREGRTRVCYDGEAFRRVLAFGNSSPQARARAALSLTRPECVEPSANPLEARALDDWRALVLEQVDTAKLPAYLANRLRLRRGEVNASLAYQLSRRGEGEKAAQASERAVNALAGVDKPELAEEDKARYGLAAVRVGASRWAVETVAPKPGPGPRLEVKAGSPGETCLRLLDAKAPAAPLLEKCTFGVVWPASARGSPKGAAVAVAVGMLEGWTELWVFHKDSEGWKLDALAPGTQPELGYVELAGFSPDGAKMLVARESLVEGKVKSSFQVLSLETLLPEKTAGSPDALSAFSRWSSADWRGRTLAVR